MCLRGYIQLARAMSVSLSGLLQGRLESATFFSRVPQKPRRVRWVDVEKVTSELAKAIEKGRSLNSVARQTGHCQRTLKYVAPALCALVLEQSRTQRHARRDRQLAAVSDKTLEIARELTRQGRPFTNRNIALLTSGPWKAFDSMFRLLFRHLLAGHSLEDLAMPIDHKVKLAVEQAVSRHKEAVGSPL